MRLATLAPGKVNLCLFVGARATTACTRSVSIVQPVSLADELILEPAERDESSARASRGRTWPPARSRCSGRPPAGTSRCASRSASTSRSPPAWAAGSSDAAATLRLAAAAAGVPVPRELAPRLGSDVPALLAAPGPALVTGAGERGRAAGAAEPLALVHLAVRARALDGGRLPRGRPARRARGPGAARGRGPRRRAAARQRPRGRGPLAVPGDRRRARGGPRDGRRARDGVGLRPDGVRRLRRPRAGPAPPAAPASTRAPWSRGRRRSVRARCVSYPEWWSSPPSATIRLRDEQPGRHLSGRRRCGRAVPRRRGSRWCWCRPGPPTRGCGSGLPRRSCRSTCSPRSSPSARPRRGVPLVLRRALIRWPCPRATAHPQAGIDFGALDAITAAVEAGHGLPEVVRAAAARSTPRWS